MNYILDLSWKTPEEFTALADALKPYVFAEIRNRMNAKQARNIPIRIIKRKIYGRSVK